MRWHGFIQRCFGDRDESIGPVSAQPPKAKPSATPPANPEPPSETAKNEQQDQAAKAESSATTSERQQSEQSQSDATQPTTLPTSTGSSAKVNSDADEITATKSTPQISPPAAIAPPDPDEITPVQPTESRYTNVKDALDDRRKLYERLRRKPEGESPVTEVQSASQQAPAEPSKAGGIKPVAVELSES